MDSSRRPASRRDHLTKTSHEVRIRLQPGADPEAIELAMRSLPGAAVRSVRMEKHSGDLVLRVALEVSPRADSAGLLATIATRDDITDLETVFERGLITD